MRDVRDELAALALGLLQRVRHRVEGTRQLADLARAVVVHPGVEIALGKGARSSRHLADGARLTHTHPRRSDEGEQQHDDARHQEHGENARHIVVSRPVSVTANTAPTVQMSDSIGTPTTKRLLS